MQGALKFCAGKRQTQHLGLFVMLWLASFVVTSVQRALQAYSIVVVVLWRWTKDWRRMSISLVMSYELWTVILIFMDFATKMQNIPNPETIVIFIESSYIIHEFKKFIRTCWKLNFHFNIIIALEKCRNGLKLS